MLLLSIPAGCAEKGDKMTTEHKFTNHLTGENSPYLLSHAHNPVDWYPWGEEALKRAKAEDKPIFLSIGYAACHWCHVMERESFENEQIAAILNENFISIKVDREQRPDLDEIYMSFTTALTGSGGWPMSVFLTPDLKPFFAGTYFPPEDRYGRPGFRKVIIEIGQVYREQRTKIVQSSEAIFQQVTRAVNTPVVSGPLKKEMVSRGAATLLRSVDPVHGGFGGAPKFPHALELSLLLRQFKATGDPSYLHATEQALSAMARGGIFDHVGGGFARYATDERWNIPHFEKMLYDNALLVPVYIEAYQIMENPMYLEVVRRTLDFMLREMSGPHSGFYSALDADSEGEEGKFYIWTKQEIGSVLGKERAKIFCQYYNVSNRGNFEGRNNLYVDIDSDRIRTAGEVEDFDAFLNECRKELLARRAQRVRPLTDDKVLTSWNGLALTALCKGFQITGEKKYLEAAIANAKFIAKELYSDGKLTHSFRDGKHSNGQFLEDYAYFVQGLLDLYESDNTGDNEKWLKLAVELADTALGLFRDADGAFYLRPSGQVDLLYRPREETDSSVPSPGSIMMSNLLKLSRITDRESYTDAARQSLEAVSEYLQNSPNRMTSALFALDYYFNDKIEIVVVGREDKRRAILREIYSHYLPNKIVAVSHNGSEQSPLFEGRSGTDGEVKVFVCRNSVCNLPATSLQELKGQLEKL
jgi:uncharacterized protein YyaL (SSP411 family)